MARSVVASMLLSVCLLFKVLHSSRGVLAAKQLNAMMVVDLGAKKGRLYGSL